MLGTNDNDILSVIQRDILERIDNKQLELYKLKNKSKSLLFHNSKYQNEILILKGIDKALDKVLKRKYEAFNISNDIVNDLESLSKLLTLDEVKRLQTYINEAIKLYNNRIQEKFGDDLFIVYKLIIDAGLKYKNITIYEGVDEPVITDMKFGPTIDKYYKDRKFTSNDIVFSTSNTSVNLGYNKFFKKLSELNIIDIVGNNEANIISNNLDKIKELYKQKLISSNILSLLNSIAFYIKKLNYSKLDNYLSKLYNKYNLLFTNTTRYLKKIKFDFVEEEVENSLLDEEEEKNKDLLEKYKELIYQLHKTIFEEPNDKQKIASIKGKIERLEKKLDVLDIRIEEAYNEGYYSYIEHDNSKKNSKKVAK